MVSMKKFFISLFTILLYFLAITSAYCEEDFFTNSNFSDAKPKTKIQTNIENKTNNIKKTTSKKFNLFKKKNKKEENSSGYWGKLPDIEEDFKYKNQNSASTNDIGAKIPDREDIDDENLKPAPFDDSLFLDVIVKEKKSSNYVNDLQKTKFALQSLRDCIMNQGDIQRFNGCVNLIDLYVKNLKTKYENSSESLKESYQDILATNYYAKVLGNLKYDANYYSRYIPTQQGQYSNSNIKKEEENLLNRINRTLFLINQES